MSKLRGSVVAPPAPVAVQADAREKIAEDTGKSVINWTPFTNSDIAVELENCVIYGIPEYLDHVTGADAKITHAILGEILSLRERLDDLNKLIASGRSSGAGQAVQDQAQLENIAEQRKVNEEAVRKKLEEDKK